jgi:tetratricopeptide (TPR) repeat protein
MKKLVRLSTLSFFALLLLPTLACLNTYEDDGGENFNSNKTAISQIKYILSRNKSNVLSELNRHKLDYEKRLGLHRGETKRYHGESSRHEAESNYAVVLLRMGKTSQALSILERLITEHPQEYNIIANLGTTYELTGQNEKALQYIKKGLEMNKESHKGSEWIHVKILEAKIAMKQNPNWLKENAILGREATGILESKNEEKIKQLIQDLGYQLFERTQFIQPKDVMVGDLIMFLGKLYAQVEDYEYAVEAYKLAETYTVSKPEVLQASIATAKKNKTQQQKNAEKEQEKEPVSYEQHEHNEQQETKRSPMFIALLLGALAVLVGSVWFMYFRKG